MKKKKNKEDHDPNRCFRCRLHDLYFELRKDNEPKFMLASMAEACGSMLSQLDGKDFTDFMLCVFKIMMDDKVTCELEKQTKH